MKTDNLITARRAAALWLAWLPLLAAAAPVSPDEAMAEVRTFRSLNSNVRRMLAPSQGESLEIAWTATAPAGGQSCFYIINDSSGAGFTIVSADDRLPRVLGFSQSGAFDPDNVPSNMQWWLDEYRDQIARFLSEDPDLPAVRQRALRQDRDPIQPMLTTLWNQGAPYNNDCPIDPRVGQRSVTGCVATAMAQVMNYHQWPVNPKGTSPDGYVFNGSTLDWANMIDDYSNPGYSSAQAAAVSLLMRQCGAAVQMMYSAYESGAYSENVPVALRTYFDYAPDLRMEWRDYHTQSEWDNMVYGELSGNRPVYYAGQSNLGGHAFVCDGYLANDFFHFNWGWGGYQDGYFLLSALNPATGGTGSYAGGYNASQRILTGVRKNEGDVGPVQTAALATGSFSYNASTSKFVITEDPDRYNMIYNPLMTPLTATFGVKVQEWDNPDNVRYFSTGSSTTLQPLYGFKDMSVNISGLSSGKYKVFPAFNTSASGWQDVGVMYSKQRYVTLTVDGSKYTYTNDGPSLGYRIVASLPESTPTVFGDVAKAFELILSNVGDGDFNEEVSISIFDDDDPFGDIISLTNRVILPAGTSTVAQFTSPESLRPSNYSAYLMTMDGTDLGDPVGMRIENAGTQPVEVSDITVAEVGPNFLTLDGEGVPVSMIVTNNTSADKSYPLEVILMDSGFKTIQTMTSAEPVDFAADASTNIQFAPRQLPILPGTYYWAVNINGKRASLTYPMVVRGAVLTDGNGLYYQITSDADKTVRITSPAYSEYEGEITIPAAIADYRVSEIAGNAFTFAGDLTEVSIPSSVSEIVPGTFYSATGLKRVNIDNPSVPTLWKEAFQPGLPEQIVLSPADGQANLYAADADWSEFIISSWTIETAPDCEITGGLEIDPLTGTWYAPYCVGADERLAIIVKTPGDMVLRAEWTIDGEQGRADSRGTAILPPLQGRNGSVRLSATDDDSGIDSLTAAWEPCDVYRTDGIRVLTNASREAFEALPSGIYILRGVKISK